MAAEDTTPELVAPQPVVAKKKKGLKRLKGLITGKSRRERRKAKAAAAAQKLGADDNASAMSLDVPDDASTVYGAELDGASVMDKSVSSTAKSTVIADPVQIILLIMDPSTRRFELLQLEFDSAMAKVSDIFKQIPTAATEEVLQKASYAAIITAKGEKLNPEANLSEYFTGAAVVVAVPESSVDNLQKCATMAIPILTNSKVNKMLLSSGIKPEDLPEKPVKKAATTPVKIKTESVESIKEIVSPLKAIDEKNEKAEKKVEDESTNYFFTGILVAIFLHLFIKAHLYISAPLKPGSILAPGKFKDSCGLLGSVPFYSCSPKKVIMGTDGILTVLHGDNVAATLYGGQCSAGKACTDGVSIQDDGSLLIAGEKAKAKVKPTVPLSPWPFSEEVVFKTGRF